MKPVLPIILSAALGLAPDLFAQDPASQDPKELARRIAELERVQKQLLENLGSISQEVERSQFQDLVPSVGESRFGLGPAASKIYDLESGLSIGGYGEFLFTDVNGETDVFDAQRFILYFGYRFGQHWVLNSEIEIEHGSTDESGSVSLEMGTIDYLYDPTLNLRGGLILVPMGLINEKHEPTTFLTASRSATEQAIIPSTWRALGAGLFGESHGFAYRAYGINSLDGEDFSSSGLRGGRQKGSKVQADDFSFVGRLDYVEVPGMTIGGSLYFGPTGQDGVMGSVRIPRLDTFIWDLHADYQHGPWTLRALFAQASVDDTAEFNANTGETLASRMQGAYIEAGFELLSGMNFESEAALTPYVRFENLDTQVRRANGFAKDKTKDNDIWTFGINFKPIDQIVFKVDFEVWENRDDRFNVLMGFMF